MLYIIYIYMDERVARKLSLQDCHGDECVCMLGTSFTSLPRRLPRDRGFVWVYQEQQNSNKAAGLQTEGTERICIWKQKRLTL